MSVLCKQKQFEGELQPISGLLVSFMPLCRRRGPSGDVLRTYLPVMFHDHTLQPLDFVRHGTVSSLKCVEHCVDTFHSLLSHHPYPNPPFSNQLCHMVLQHADLWRHWSSEERAVVIIIIVHNLRKDVSISDVNSFELLNSPWHLEYRRKALPYLFATPWSMSSKSGQRCVAVWVRARHIVSILAALKGKVKGVLQYIYPFLCSLTVKHLWAWFPVKVGLSVYIQWP